MDFAAGLDMGRIGFALANLVFFKGALLLCTACGVAVLLRRRSASLRSAVWTATFALLLGLPLADATLPSLALFGGEDEASTLGAVTRSALVPGDIPVGPLRSVGPPAASGVSPEGAETPGSAIAFERAATSLALSAPAEAGPSSTGALVWGAIQRNLVGLAVVLWGVGVLMALTGLFADGVRVKRLLARARRVEVQDPLLRFVPQKLRDRMRVVVSEELPMPMVTGVGQAILALPVEAERWGAERLQAVTLHEAAHVERRDLHTHLLGELARAFYWPNPLVWIAIRRSRHDRERACDDMVLGMGIDPLRYARHLLDLARSWRTSAPLGAVAMARPSGLRVRVDGVLDNRADRRPLGVRSGALVVLAGLAVSLPLAVATIGAAPAAQGSTAALIAQLSAPDRMDRLAAIRSLALACEPGVVEALRAELGGTDPLLKDAAARSLAEIDLPEAREALLGALRQESDIERVAVLVEALGHASSTPQVDRALAARLDDARSSVRLLAARALQGRVRLEAPVVEALERLSVNDPVWATRAAAFRALADLECGWSAENLKAAVRDPDKRVRMAALELVISLPPSVEAHQALVAFSRDCVDEIRGRALCALDALGVALTRRASRGVAPAAA